MKRRSAKARERRRVLLLRRYAGAGRAQPASAAATTPTATNETAMPTDSATAPNIGPRMAPKTAAPRRSRSARRAARAASRPSARRGARPRGGAREALTSRAAPSAHGPSAAANAKLETVRSTRPATTALFGPQRAAARPPGIPPRSAPAPKAATSSPAPPWRARLVRVARHERRERPNSIASTNTTTETRTRSRRIRQPTLPTHGLSAADGPSSFRGLPAKKRPLPRPFSCS